MDLSKEKRSKSVIDNPSGWRQKVDAWLNMGRQARKVDPPEAISTTSQSSNKLDKADRDDVQRSNYWIKRPNENRKRNRELPKGLSGGW